MPRASTRHHRIYRHVELDRLIQCQLEKCTKVSVYLCKFPFKQRKQLVSLDSDKLGKNHFLRINRRKIVSARCDPFSSDVAHCAQIIMINKYNNIINCDLSLSHELWWINQNSSMFWPNTTPNSRSRRWKTIAIQNQIECLIT